MKQKSNEELQKEYMPLIKVELSRQLGCEVDNLPLTVSKEECADFLGIKNPKTLVIWLSSGQNGIVMFKSGRETRPAVKWMLEYKANSILSGPEEGGEGEEK